ncbi:hypothetical protein F441_20869 [Phytophthora nicotianae CJ01A1]|uniref:Uncharacterized protein n=6 Tax=Phytophthora nicotianae TaxID=4792 RepID=W2PGG9_PHYN3|nr:hypothetical protein PPTG_24320 [Phytophthora nicotianae INRA-310]ETI32117.1 hypothetical protein F443_21002 [Phytophthora nicotianae P1569]ETK72502.1 hypothetical protein L915_20404 [Phytophthora nicotianae]ETO60859.1 hypothetical protein F444_21006 [Phytophthora nicotianae P1976]ETP01970.1 hypothetical protein F441_20869 [Phytophthora nicotianae CJ01A1]ETP30127.1 hypothetical protein F442_20810 [Phytophthora nicotianae P10297]
MMQSLGIRELHRRVPIWFLVGSTVIKIEANRVWTLNKFIASCNTPSLHGPEEASHDGGHTLSPGSVPSLDGQDTTTNRVDDANTVDPRVARQSESMYILFNSQFSAAVPL